MQLTPQRAARIIRAHQIEAYAEGDHVVAFLEVVKDGVVSTEQHTVRPTVEGVRAFLGY